MIPANYAITLKYFPSSILFVCFQFCQCSSLKRIPPESCSVVSDSFVTPWTVAHQAPLFMGFPRQECWSGLPFPSPGDLPNPGIEPRSPALQADSLLSSTVEAVKYFPSSIVFICLPFNQFSSIKKNIYNKTQNYRCNLSVALCFLILWHSQNMAIFVWGNRLSGQDNVASGDHLGVYGCHRLNLTLLMMKTKTSALL